MPSRVEYVIAVELSQRRIMREARMMRSSLTSRRRRTMRSSLSEEVLSPTRESAPPDSMKMSTGSTERKSIVNHERR